MKAGQSTGMAGPAPDPQLEAVLERSCGIYDAAAPCRETLLRQAIGPAPIKEDNMLYRLFAGRSPVMRLTVAVGLLASLAAGAVLMPRVSVTPEGPRAGYPPAWAEQAGHVLLFDFGHVQELQPGSIYHAEGRVFTLSMARAIVERLRGEVRAFRSAEVVVPQLDVFEYRYTFEFDEYMTHVNGRPGSHPAGFDRQSSYVAALPLPDPALAPKLVEFLKTFPELPAAQLVDSTWFVERGIPEPGQPGVTIGLNLTDPRQASLNDVPGYVPGQMPTQSQFDALEELVAARQQPHKRVFSYPAGASEEQIEAQLAQWMAQEFPGAEYDVDVSLSTDRYAPGVEVKIKGRSETDMQGQAADLGYNPDKVLDLRKPADRAKMRRTERGRARLKQMEEDWRASGQAVPWPTDQEEADAAALAALPPEPWSPPDPMTVMYSPETRAELRETLEGRKFLRDLEQTLKTAGAEVPWAGTEGEVAAEAE